MRFSPNERLPKNSSYAVSDHSGIGGLCIVAIVVALCFSLNVSRQDAIERTSLPGKCFELPGVKEAKVVGIHTLYRGEWVATVQTDSEGATSVAFVPLLVVESWLIPCAADAAS